MRVIRYYLSVLRYLILFLSRSPGPVGGFLRFLDGLYQNARGLGRAGGLLFGRSTWLPIRLRRSVESRQLSNEKDRPVSDHRFSYQEIPPGVYDEQLRADIRTLIPWAGVMMGVDEWKLRRRWRGVSVIEAPDLNGFVRYGPDWNGFEIVTNAGVAHAINTFVFAMAILTAFVNDGGDKVEDRTVPIGAVSPIVETLLRESLGQPLLSSPIDLAGIFLRLSERQRQFALQLSGAAHLFLPAHELGHVVLASTKRVEMEVGRLTAELVVSREQITRPEDRVCYRGKLPTPEAQLASMDAARREALVRAWSEEFAADLIALRLCEATWTEQAMLDFRSPVPAAQRRKASPCIAVGGLEMTLIFMDLSERYSLHRFGPRPINDHPPVHLRLANIRTACQLWAKDSKDSFALSADCLNDIGNAVAGVADRVLGDILNRRA